MIGRAVLVVVLLLAGVAAAAQEGQTMAETLVSQAEANLNNAVMMKGLAGRYEPGPNNTIVYTLTDRNNGTIRVRGFGELDLATTYIVFGTITRNATTSKLELVEHYRTQASTAYGKTEPAHEWPTVGASGGTTGSGGTGSEGAKTGGTEAAGGTGGTETEGTSDGGGTGGFPEWVLYAVGAFFIVLAVVLGIYLSVKQKQERERQWQVEQQHLAEEARRRQEQLDAQRGGGVSADPTRVVTSGPPPPSATIEAWGRLEVLEGTEKGKIYPLAGRSIVLGRGGDGIRLEDDAVSTRHATIAQSNDGRLLYIDESRNGSVVDSKPVHRAQAEIKDGSTIQIGVSKLKVAVVMPAAQRGGAASAAAPTVAVPVGSRPTEMFTGYELKVLNGQSAGKTFPLTQQTVTIGREEDRTIVLTDSTLSRKHATLTLEGGQFVLANESSQGTTVNGKRVERHTLQSGDEIQTGEVKMQFHKAV